MVQFILAEADSPLFSAGMWAQRPNPGPGIIRPTGAAGRGWRAPPRCSRVAAFLEGMHAQAFPSFGSARMGAPVMASCRLDRITALFEARRGLSRGNCFECGNCYGVCPDNAVVKLGPGRRFEFNDGFCKGCGIRAVECPCGAIEMAPETI